MKAIYFDCFSGTSGDMIVGALLDLGVSMDTLRSELSKLSVQNFSLSSRQVVKGNIAATKFDVQPGHEHAHRHLGTIEKIINESDLNLRVKSRAIKIFRHLAEAEAKVHGTTVDKIHFHEVGAIDSIVDIVGACIGFELLGVERFYASAINVGKGTLQCAHGALPVPAPATAELLQGIPVYSNQVEGELATPTGAAIISTLCEGYGGLPQLKLDRTGYGAGSKDIAGTANVLRLVLGEITEDSALTSLDSSEPSVVVIEANIDDMNPQIYGHLQEKLFALGVLDVYSTAVQMKKNRTGQLLSVVVPPALLEAATEMLFKETTTIGVRYAVRQRKTLDRQVEEIDLPWGTVRVKVSRLQGKIVNFTPEYDDCHQLAASAALPYKMVQARVIQEFMNRHGNDIMK